MRQERDAALQLHVAALQLHEVQLHEAGQAQLNFKSNEVAQLERLDDEILQAGVPEATPPSRRAVSPGGTVQVAYKRQAPLRLYVEPVVNSVDIFELVKPQQRRVRFLVLSGIFYRTFRSASLTLWTRSWRKRWRL